MPLVKKYHSKLSSSGDLEVKAAQCAFVASSVTRRGRFRPTWPFLGFVWPEKFGEFIT